VRAVAIAIVLAAGLAASGSAAQSPAPVLGHPWARGQDGYGRARPRTVFNGGDPTGLVQDIRWTGWGRSRAVGAGIATYVWPGTAVSRNAPTRGAIIVAFHLGTCRGRPSYNAVEWFFPRYDESFDPHTYVDACTGGSVRVSAPTARCSTVRLAGSRTAKDVLVTRMSCGDAARLIRTMPVGRYLRSGGRFVRDGFRCGTEGLQGRVALFECRLARRDVVFSVQAGS
jgi:hypothetical protein